MKATVAEAVKIAVAPLHDEINELRKQLMEAQDKTTSLQDTLMKKSEHIEKLENKVVTTNRKNIELQALIAEKSDFNEQYGRKDILRIEGIEYTENEDKSTLQKSVIEKLAKENVIIQKSDIFRLHRS